MEQVPESEGFPFFAYCYDERGHYGDPDVLGSDGQLARFLLLVVPMQMKRRLEVRITDRMDNMVFWAKDGRVLWPTEDGVPPDADA